MRKKTSNSQSIQKNVKKNKKNEQSTVKKEKKSSSMKTSSREKIRFIMRKCKNTNRQQTTFNGRKKYKNGHQQ